MPIWLYAQVTSLASQKMRFKARIFYYLIKPHKFAIIIVRLGVRVEHRRHQ
jgi:hypothetical protein